MEDTNKRKKSIIKRKSIVFIEVPEIENEDLFSPIRKFNFIEIVGKGSFGKVYKCMNKGNAELFAVKVKILCLFKKIIN
jgi:hypothetical protein